MPVTPLLKINVDVLMVEGFIASLKVTVMGVSIATPVLPSAGLVEMTVGGVVSTAPVTVKLHV